MREYIIHLRMLQHIYHYSIACDVSAPSRVLWSGHACTYSIYETIFRDQTFCHTTLPIHKLGERINPKCWHLISQQVYLIYRLINSTTNLISLPCLPKSISSEYTEMLYSPVIVLCLNRNATLTNCCPFWELQFPIISDYWNDIF